MLGKFLVRLKTALALKFNNMDRVSDAYKAAKNIGLLYSYDEEKNKEFIDELIAKFESDQKRISQMVFVPSSVKDVEHEYAFFTDEDLNNQGNWVNDGVNEFKDETFDFLVSIDMHINKYTQSILASAKAKCRVGRYEEGKSKYFELMINTGNEKYYSYLDQIYHYLTNVRNG